MNMVLTRRPAAGVILSLSLLFLAGCDQRKIEDIRADPHRYADREVGVVGVVTESFGIMGRGVYQIDDGTGRLWVVTEKGVPAKGVRVAAKGKIRQGFQFSSFIKLPLPMMDGLVMIESGHKKSGD